jgi:serine/threonine-protein kinase HipA
MKLSVYVQGRDVAVLEQEGDFKSILTYHANTAHNDFVSLTMPVRTESWVWDDTLPPVLQMNLPEGYLLQVLQEKFGPVVGSSPIALLSVVGRNMVGRIQVAPPGANLDEPAKPIEVAEILQGDNSEQTFATLVREHAASGISGIVPKFLDTQLEQFTLGYHQKASLLTRRHIIKGSSHRLPFVTLNEHLCMQVAAKVLPTAKTEISQDGQALIVNRFDVDENGALHWGMEDFCALLGLRPAAKYETTWERIAKAVHDHVPGERQLDTFRQLTKTLLLTYALRNADCHSKNIALLYTSQEDVHLAPVYDIVTTNVYANYENNPPGIAFMGKKTWTPGKNLEKFIARTFGINPKEQVSIVESIAQAVSEVGPAVRVAMKDHPEFMDTGKRMLLTWQEGVDRLRDKHIYALGAKSLGEAFSGFSDPPKLKSEKLVVGRSELIGKRK